MDARLIPGESYFIAPRGNVKYLGLRDARAYFSAKDGKIFIVALASALERIGDSIKLNNPQNKFYVGDLDIFSKRDRTNLEVLTAELSGAIQ